MPKIAAFLFLKVFGVENDVHGVTVLVQEHESVEWLPVIEDALNLIKTHDPVRFERLREDLTGGIHATVGQHETAWFDSDEWICHIDRVNLDEEEGVESIAMSIVHEATHARLWKLGFHYDPEIRFRVEQICIRRELAFARTIPDNEEWIEYIQSCLDWLTEEYLTDEGFTERERRKWIQSVRDIREHGFSFRAIRMIFVLRAILSGQIWRNIWTTARKWTEPKPCPASTSTEPEAAAL